MKDDIIRDGIQTDGAFHFMTKPNMKLSVFLLCQFQVVCITWVKSEVASAAPGGSKFRQISDRSEREGPNMADNVAETLDKMNIEESKDVRYI